MDVVGGPDLAHVWVPRSRIQVGLANSHAKILTAYKSREEQQTILARPVVQRTPHTVMDPQAIAAELAEVARTGVAFDCEEEVVGICGVGAPIRDRTGAVIASVAIVAPAKRFGLERRGALADLVRRGAAAMSSRLGYQPPQ
jgi:DNA-binding IclR family transcriptional regulator